MESNKSTILLVDDREANILALEKLLEKTDRLFFTATSGEAALKIAFHTEIDLVILDVQMPEMDGFEVAQVLKSNRRTKDIPIIFASAEKKEHKSMMKGFEEGAVDYLPKPLDPEITKAKVAVLLELQRQRKELIEKNISLERSALLINNSADIIGVINASSLLFEEVNSAMYAILGYTPEEVRGTSLEFFLTEEDKAMVHRFKGMTNEHISFDTNVQCKDTTTKWLQWNVVIKDDKWFVNARDIGVLKQVKKITNYLATIVKQSNDAIYIYDETGKIISWNEGAQRIYGYTEQEAFAMQIGDFIPLSQRDQAQHMMEQLFDQYEVQYLETQRLSKDGNLIEVLFSASVIVDPESNRRAIAITERDITQHKRTADQIKQLNHDLHRNVLQLQGTNKELEAFTYSVSHDLRAPLRALNGYTRMLEEDCEDAFNDHAKELLTTIKKNTLKMGHLIDDLLEFSKVGKTEVKKTKINMGAVVKEVVGDITPMNANKPNITIHPLLPSFADYSLITQVWVNLISNAIKYSGKKPHPQIEIGSLPNDQEVIYYVKDNGAGFDMAYGNKLFGVFQRLHSPKEFEGTGIGLAIIHRVITKHGGRVWAESKVNEGATFYFTLPHESGL